MKVSQHPQKPLGGSNQIWAMTSGKKDMYSDLRGHSMYIATRRARLEARGAGFLVYNNCKEVYVLRRMYTQEEVWRQ